MPEQMVIHAMQAAEENKRIIEELQNELNVQLPRLRQNATKSELLEIVV
jgi:F0F1-type ATP synthase gamma subunit